MRKYLFIPILCIYTFPSFSQISEKYQLESANKTVIQWFNNLNSGDYGKCWKDISIELQIRLDSLDWVIGIHQVMAPFGDLTQRKETNREFRSSFEGLPDGYYAIFEYVSNYKNTVEHSERIILHQDDKRRWKVLDYGYEFTEGKDYKEFLDADGNPVE